MKTKKLQESQRLLNSVRAQFNLSNELDSRREEAEQGLSQHEQAFVEKYPSGSCLLDIGCASGRLCFALAQRGYTATGIDIAEKQIAQAKQIAEKKGIGMTFLHYEPPTLPFPDASFAAAFLENVYCYIPHRDARIAFLEEIARVLYSDGQLFISQPILDAVFDNYEPIYDDNYHQFATDYETLEEGDNFYLGASTYVHHFFFKDLKAEFDASPFQLLDSSVNVKDDDKVRCVLQKHVSD